MHAVSCVSFDNSSCETLCLIGESGCGKSTTSRLILRPIEPTAGKVCFEGRNVTAAGHPQMVALRRDMQITFSAFRMNCRGGKGSA
jgi:ABC-type oligopeptide transport system ATPase subunit